MQLSLEELVEIAIKNQPIILEQELQKGVPLNYIDEHGHTMSSALPMVTWKKRNFPG